MIPDKQHCGHELPAYICDEDNLGDIHDILTAALAGNDLSTLPQRWNQELGIIRSRSLDKHDAALVAQTEIRMVEALEHVASTESWIAMNAFIEECRKQAEKSLWPGQKQGGKD